MMKQMEVPFVMLPDTDGTVDTPTTGEYSMYGEGGTKISEIRELGDCNSSLGLGMTISTPNVELLDKKFKVKGKTRNNFV